ncbi:MAG TPA: recombinase family protein, partial [Humibacillus sp.]|nr:recombinase family protein [Humibacillus sp.]
MTVPAGIYLRISRDSEGLGLGVKRQLADCAKLVERLSWSVVEVYEDNDVSATRSKPRPAYLRMMQDVERGRIKAVAVWDV